MKKVFTTLSAVLLFSLFAFSQKPIRPASLGISFLMFDYKTPALIRSTSFSSVRANDQWAPLANQAPGIGLHFFKGLTPHIDFAGSLAGSFVRYKVGGKNQPSADQFLLEADAAANFKLLPENYAVTPYLHAGAGLSVYKVYWGAFVPLGLGLKANLANEAEVFLNFQYRIPVTKETAAHHFVTGIGVTGLLGNN